MNTYIHTLTFLFIILLLSCQECLLNGNQEESDSQVEVVINWTDVPDGFRVPDEVEISLFSARHEKHSSFWLDSDGGVINTTGEVNDVVLCSKLNVVSCLNEGNFEEMELVIPSFVVDTTTFLHEPEIVFLDRFASVDLSQDGVIIHSSPQCITNYFFLNVIVQGEKADEVEVVSGSLSGLTDRVRVMLFETGSNSFVMPFKTTFMEEKYQKLIPHFGFTEEEVWLEFNLHHEDVVTDLPINITSYLAGIRDKYLTCTVTLQIHSWDRIEWDVHIESGMQGSIILQ